MEYKDPARSVPRAGQASLVSAGVKRLILLLMAAGAVSAQIYPPVGYPYPRGTGIPLPIPGQKGKSTDPLPNYRGKLKQMDEKTITLVLNDDRELLFKRDGKTKFYKGGDEIKSPKFAVGDQLSIEGPVYGNGYMLAVNVYWERGASADSADATSHAKGDESVTDTWKDAPKPPPSASGGTAPPATQSAPPQTTQATPQPPAKPDADDPGPPTLKRGSPADVNREHAAPLPEIPPTGPATPPAPPMGAAPTRPANADDDNTPIIRNGDDLIRRATAAAMDFTEGLPNYICKENIGRYQSESHVPDWRAIDVVTTDVIYENHKESYKNLTINGKPTKKSMEESGGSWSTGEFGTVLVNLFSPGVAEFHYVKDSRAGAILAKLYSFSVTHANSTWSVHVEGQTYDPAYRGSVWIDPHTGRVLRIEQQAYGFPADFPTDHVEMAIDYEYTRLGDTQQYLLPVHSENLMCQRGSDFCTRNSMDFRNYRKYEGESTITYK